MHVQSVFSDLLQVIEDKIFSYVHLIVWNDNGL